MLVQAIYGEKPIRTISHRGILMELVACPSTIWCGSLGSALDTEQEPERIQRARAFIGDELFDYLLHPPIRLGDRDTSKDGDFGG